MSSNKIPLWVNPEVELVSSLKDLQMLETSGQFDISAALPMFPVILIWLPNHHTLNPPGII
jgi:hypothetical protein